MYTGLAVLSRKWSYNGHQTSQMGTLIAVEGTVTRVQERGLSVRLLSGATSNFHLSFPGSVT